ncbi:MAG TPA: thiamine pyrophosphate-binding protein [Candidatus Limnocylindria bacterium]
MRGSSSCPQCHIQRILRGAVITTVTRAAVKRPSSGPVVRNVARAVAHELRALGIDHLFLMTGRDNSLWIALEEVGIHQVLARSEGAAVYMADAYARVSGRPALTYGAYGPGAANVAGALAEPFWSSSPVVALVSAMRRTERFRKEYQELDQVPLFSSVTKWGAEASDRKHVPRLVREAVRRAVSGTPGPVYLGIPGDIFEEELPDYQEPTNHREPVSLPLTRPAPSVADAEAVVRALTAASRPVILAGTGVHQSGAYDALRQLAERLAIPVATSSGGKGSIADNHELALGTAGRYSRIYSSATVRDADVVLAIGTALGGMVTDTFKLITPDTFLIHVTIDPEVIGLNFPPNIGIVADARAFLEAVLSAAERMEALPSPNSSVYLAELATTKLAWLERRATLAAKDGNDGQPMRPEAIMAAIDENLPSDGIIVADTGYSAAWGGALADVKQAGRNFIRADGSLGWAFPAALGAQMAAPDRQVVCITGDGGVAYHIADIETALRHNLPVTVVVLNNGILAFEEHVQNLLYGHVVPEVDRFVDVDYGAVARAFGASGFRVSNAADFRAALAAGFERRTVTIIDAVIDREALAPVTRYDRVREREL